ncbi:MAG: hypothetical protein ACI82Z_001596 [Cellvibrionaceae bacterium]|jgi:hypothetical protein
MSEDMDKSEIIQEETSISSSTTAEPSSKPKPKAAAKRKAKPKVKREFPQHTIEESRKVLDTIKDYNSGNPWSPTDIAAALDMGKGNNFYYLTASARAYGLTLGTRDSAKIDIGQIGRKLAYPKTPAEEYSAVEEAFLNIDLFKKVYEYYQGENLPEIQYLKNTLKAEFGVDETLQDEFYELYQKNLKFIKKTSDKTGVETKASAVSDSGSSSIVLGESTSASDLVAFVAMPFSEKTSDYPEGYFDEVLKHLITPAAVKTNFNAKTAKKSGSEVIQSTIVNDLDTADVVIVGLTEHNPNVLFELGMRIAFNKPVCLIRAKGTAPNSI